MTYGSVYEITNPLTTVAKQHFVEWFSGEDLDSKRWAYADYLSSNHTGSGMVNDIDGGFKLVGDSSTAGSQNTLISFNDKKQYSNTGSVVIWIAKVELTGSSKQGGWGMCGTMPSYWLNGIKVSIPNNNTKIDFP